MKKLMFGLALALSATCLADAIESNIVGYQQYELNGAGEYAFFAPMFDSTSSATLKLNDLTMKGALGSGGDFIQIINPDATLGEKYVWLTMAGTFYLNDGWYSSDWSKKLEGDNAVIIEDGQGFYVRTATEGVVIQSSGSVRLTEKSIPLNGDGNYTIVGNTTPVNLDLQSIKLSNAQGSGGDFIQIINPDATLGEKYVWLTMAGTFYLNDGWYSSDWSKKLEGDNAVTINAGQGFYIRAANSTTELLLPSPVQ